MARGMNHVYLQGALVRDPETKVTENGTFIWEATIANEDEVVGSDGQTRKLPWYHRISQVGRSAEILSEQNLKGGDALFVEGTLEYRQWEDQLSGDKRSMVRVRALRVERCGFDINTVADSNGGLRGTERSINEVMLIGNLTRDPEMSHTNSGDNVANLGLAVNEVFNNRAGERQEQTHFIDIKAWRQLADTAGTMSKGTPALIKGRLLNENWNDQNGNKRSATRVEATLLQPLQGRGSEAGAGNRNGAPSRSTRPAAAAQSRGNGTAGGAAAGKTAAKPNAASNRTNQRTAQRSNQSHDDLPPEEEEMPF